MIGAVDIGGTKIAVGIVDAHGNVMSKVESPTDVSLAYSNGLEQITSMLREAAHTAGMKISGIGIGSTGPVNPFTGAFGDVDFIPQWRGKNLAEDLARIFGVQVVLENDGDAGALAEAAWGAGRNKSRLIYITVGTGIGGGIILDGKLYRGVDGAHPEVGHQVIDPSGPLCTCGYQGCWEALASGPAIVARFKGSAATDSRHDDVITAKLVCQLAQQGDELAIQAAEREAYYLGLGLANLVNLFTPDAIVLGGSVMKSADLFLDGIRKVIAKGCRFVPFGKTELALASLGDDVNLIGGARAWHHRFGPEGQGA